MGEVSSTASQARFFLPPHPKHTSLRQGASLAPAAWARHRTTGFKTWQSQTSSQTPKCVQCPCACFPEKILKPQQRVGSAQPAGSGTSLHLTGHGGGGSRQDSNSRCPHGGRVLVSATQPGLKTCKSEPLNKKRNMGILQEDFHTEYKNIEGAVPA